MNTNELSRWGKLLDILSEISDVERQLVLQGERPGSFVPDELLERWYHTYRGGRGLGRAGVSEEIQSILMDFDLTLMDLTDILPDDAHDKAHYIRHDEIWRAICELANLTLTRIAMLGMPDDPPFSIN